MEKRAAEKWSDEKKSFCCGKVGLGCPKAPETTTPVSRPFFFSKPLAEALFDCSEKLGSWEDDWTPLKRGRKAFRERTNSIRGWCCKYEGKACQPFDCAAWLKLFALCGAFFSRLISLASLGTGRRRSRIGSLAKRWMLFNGRCCIEEQKGCADSTTEKSFDCEARQQENCFSGDSIGSGCRPIELEEGVVRCQEELVL